MLREVPAGGGAASRAVCVPHEIPREAPRAAAGAALGPRIKAKGLCPPVPGAPAAACVSPAEGVRGSGPGLSHRAAGGGGELRGGACWSISARTARGGAWLVAQVPRQPGREPREMPAPTPPRPGGHRSPGAAPARLPAPLDPSSCGDQGWGPCALHPEAHVSCGARPGPTGESQGPSPLSSSRDRCGEQPRSRPVAGSPRKGALIRTPGFGAVQTQEPSARS